MDKKEFGFWNFCMWVIGFISFFWMVFLFVYLMIMG
jgi:hypothetical protein